MPPDEPSGRLHAAVRQAIEAIDAADDAEKKVVRQRGTMATALDRIRIAVQTSDAPAGAKDAASQILLKAARDHLVRLEDAAKRCEKYDLRREALDAAQAKLDAETRTIGDRRATLDQALPTLLDEGNLPSTTGPTGLDDAIESLASIEATLRERDGYKRQIDGIERDAADFAREVDALCVRLGRPTGSAPAPTIRAIADELAAAIDAAKRLAQLEQDAGNAKVALAALATERQLAAATIRVLLDETKAGDETAFAVVVADWAAREALIMQQSEVEGLSCGSRNWGRIFSK